MQMKLISLLILGIVLSGCSSTWQGFYYPKGDLGNESEWILSPIFDSKDKCLSWARNKKIELNDPLGDFECGKNCQSDEYGMSVCDETVDY